MVEPSDVNVDELKRRARRRLVGAIVLALAAAVFVPMLLESEPRPLGEDIAVKIPPVDDGKFVNRLNGAAAKGPGKGSPKTDAGRTDAAKIETSRIESPQVDVGRPDMQRSDAAKTDATNAAVARIEAAKGDVTPAETGGDTRSAVAPSSASAAGNPLVARRSLAEAEQKILNGSKSPPAPAAATAKSTSTSAAPANVAHPVVATATAAAAAPKTESSSPDFSVQLAAFADDKGANSLANKLKRAGYPAYTEPLTTSKGTLWRVRVGPFPSRDAAVASRDRLKGEGYAGIVAAAK